MNVQKQQDPAMDTTSPERPMPSVLVVDDDAFSRDLLQEMLAAQGVSQIALADNGRSALRTLAAMAAPPDLLICDVFMPDMDGIEFMSELAQRHYQGGVALVTGVDIETMGLARDIATAEGVRLLGTFAKPLQSASLAELLARA
jgi:CheY-like chemotaxis protein